ncbi:MAG TPA: hypothetical protein VEK57_24045 [Thermoanaerobaculia bacterium]|nr:hypothetical protein [Thermoanaerobaculia bacterium]
MNVRKNPLEWTVFAAALAIVAGCVAMLVSMMLRTGDAPPELVVTVGRAERVSSGYRVPVQVRNDGDETAEQVRVDVTLESAGEEQERAELTLAFIPRRSQRHGFVVFGRDPQCCEITARAVGFETP